MGRLTAIPAAYPARNGRGALLLTGPFYLYIRTNDEEIHDFLDAPQQGVPSKVSWHQDFVAPYDVGTDDTKIAMAGCRLIGKIGAVPPPGHAHCRD